MGMANTGCITERQKHIPKEMGILGSEIDRLFNAIDQLEAKLEAVLRNEPKPEQTQKAPEENIVVLAGDIRSLRRRISGKADQVEDILNRLEL